ncbi:hypothetical protein SAMN02746066_00887 [Anaerosporobacter mobilis DSM 15930]|jgi:hypothetical protein|uniref:Uncharacterized protein n=1 Tax=Anaerosporobacter mobilis DSM 15930 TaxID=1120996 RepID=A0A1M7G822_9FIRM|nr:DUF6323 family protein [Anaerosporobacter mobilis]SHM12326.1 hypothetical protein SAMN02746066_00887 [Anaerosporobacter mobilis DSM 15930]
MDEDKIFQYLIGQQENNQLTIQKQMKDLMACNDYTKQFGIQLSEKEALDLIKERRENLIRQERIEFGEGIITKLIFTFCDSTYIYQDNYVETIQRLQEIFYLYKNESLDELTDDELLEYMKEQLDGKCQGDLDYLEDTALEAFARKIRCGWDD